MELLVLGPVEARVDGRPIPLGAAKQRGVLAMLALRANSTVSADELMEGLWGEHPPASAPKMVQQYISQLRRLLDAEDGAAPAIVTRGRAYELRIAPDDVDASRFVRLVERGAAREGLALWRGRALDDIADEPFAAVEIRRLEELRLSALEQVIDADLADGRHGELVGELEALVAEHPLSERLHGQLMLALYRSGRQAEALEAYRRARALLVDEAGIEPGPGLQQLHAAMLRQDASLDPPPRPALPPELETTAPMFGRKAELGRLRAAWERALDGTGSLVVISGPPGSGRTRLAAELAGEVHEQRGLVLYGPSGADAARRASRPALLVLDDRDAAPPEPAGRPVLRVLVAGAATALPDAEQIRLGPLGDEAIASIARLHGQEDRAAELAERSGRLPGAAHRIAAEWAREQAERRVSAEALRTADERAGLRRAESRLTGSLADLQEMRARAERHEARRATVVCPYKGLATFDRADADFFFGRERLVAEMVARLVGSPLLGIVGASGSGKSSVMRAGLLAELAKGVLPGSEGWTQAVLRPGEHPAAALRRATRRAEPGTRLVIAVDQFEETFTLCRDPTERAEFIAALVRSVRDPVQEATVVLAVRADFYGRCAEDPELAALLAANQLLVGAMRRDELRRAIEMPAERAGLQVEPELVDALLADTADEPGALPLLSTALLELWQHRDGNRLRLAAYERTGGVRGAVARMAEAAYERLDPEQQVVARRIMLRLAGDEGGAHVRRRVPLAELEADRVLDVLADSRLVTVSEGNAEVAHEALLQEWPRLRGWLEEDAEGRRVHAHLAHAAREWSHDRDRSELYRGARLASALEWRAEHEPELNTTEQQFLDASRVASERARRRMQLVLAGVVALLVGTAVAALLALDQRGRARTEARAAEAQRLGAQALNADTLDLSLLLARQGVALDDEQPAQLNLLAALRRSPAAVGAIQTGLSRLVATDLPAGGGPLAVTDLNGSVAFLDPATRRRLGLHRLSTGAFGGPLASSPDGSRLAAVGFDAQRGYVELFDPRTRRHIAQLRLTNAGSVPETAVFTPDSRELLVQGRDDYNWLWRWDARTGRLLREETRLPGRDVRLLGFAGGQLVTFSLRERATIVRDPATLRVARRLPLPSPLARLNSPLGMVAFAGRDGSVRLLDLGTGRLRRAAGSHDAPVTALGFSADGRILVTAGRDEQLIVWDTRRAVAVETLPAGGVGVIDDLTVTPDGRTAYTAGRDGTVVAWDLEGSRRFERPLRGAGGGPIGAHQLVASGRASRFATIDDAGSIDVFHGATLRHAGRIPLVDRGRAQAAALAPDDRTLAITDLDGRVGFWDLRTRRLMGEPVYGHGGGVPIAVFSADGRWLVTGGSDDIMRIWDARRRRMRDSLIFSGASDLSLNPEGDLLASARFLDSFSGGLELISVPKLAIVRRVRAPRGTLARFTPDGRALLYGDREGRVWIYDTRTWKPRRTPLFVTSPLLTADFSPDGRMLATTSVDGEARLWDVASGRPIGGVLPDAPGDLVGAGFVDDGRRLVVVHERGGYGWDLRPASWARHACAVAGRTLTRSEWAAALPGRSYEPACAGR